jgi:hypothetical protein
MKSFKLITCYLWVNLCEMAWVNIPSTFIKIKNHLKIVFGVYLCFWVHMYITFVFTKYSNLSLNKIKWNNFFNNILLKVYFNIICKNIVKIFQKFNVGCIQTCTSLESSTMWHPKWGHHSVLSPCIVFH